MVEAERVVKPVMASSGATMAEVVMEAETVAEKGVVGTEEAATEAATEVATEAVKEAEKGVVGTEEAATVAVTEAATEAVKAGEAMAGVVMEVAPVAEKVMVATEEAVTEAVEAGEAMEGETEVVMVGARTVANLEVGFVAKVVKGKAEVGTERVKVDLVEEMAREAGEMVEEAMVVDPAKVRAVVKVEGGDGGGYGGSEGEGE